MKHGVSMEPHAKNMFVHLMKRSHKAFSAHDCRLVLSNDTYTKQAGADLEGEHAYAGAHLEGEHAYAGADLEGEHAHTGSQRCVNFCGLHKPDAYY